MGNTKVKSGSGTSSPTIPELILELRSSFFASDFQNLATKFTEHEELLKKKYNDLKKKSEEENKLLISENLKLNNELKKKETEIEALKKQNEEKVRVFEKLMMDLKKRVDVLQEIAEKCEANQLQNTAPSASNRPVLSTKKGVPTKRTETKSKEIIEIVSDDDDDDDNDVDVVDDDQIIGTLKRRRVSIDVKKEYDSDFKTTPTAKLTETIGAQKSNIFDESNSQRITSPQMEIVNEAYKLVAAKLKNEKNWKSEDEMKIDFDKDDDLCLAAVCALIRQKRIVYWSDNERCTRLARLLMDGNLHIKPLKKAAELASSDLNDCRQLAKIYVSQIFEIFENKTDPFFRSKS